MSGGRGQDGRTRRPGRRSSAVDDRRVEESALGAESPEVIETAAAVGERRLRRLSPAHALTALIGGLAVSFGAVAMAWTAGPWLAILGQERSVLLGAVAFPIGFVILLVGSGELFTENFFVPVTGVMEGRGTVRDLLILWVSTLFFNLVGAAIFAWLVTRSGVFGDTASVFMRHYALDKLDYPFWTALVKAIFAGWLMTVLTWLVLASASAVQRLVVIWIIGFLIVAGHFNHVVISAAEIFMAIGLGAPITLGAWFERSFVPALIGNLIGGVVFVTLLGYVHARSLRESERRASRS
ncbi:MAG TPA: formate/nitrite transporter family protein [Thermomicrobiaceae bacterium]|nr:formate/nitrite transporter family protein [Thermomicrobiaceae bacterium]